MNTINLHNVIINYGLKKVSPHFNQRKIMFLGDSLNSDTFEPSVCCKKARLEKQEDIMKKLAGVLNNPNPNARDLKKIKKIIKENTGRDFKPTLDSKTTIRMILNEGITVQDCDIPEEFHGILNKTFENKVSIGSFKGINIFIVGEGLKMIEEKFGAELKPAKDRYYSALEDHKHYTDKLFRQRRKLIKKLIKLKEKYGDLRGAAGLRKNFKPELQLTPPENVLKEYKHTVTKLNEITKRKSGEAYKRIVLPAENALCEIERKIGIDIFRQKEDIDGFVGLIGNRIGEVYEDIASAEVKRVIIPKIAKKLAKEELLRDKGEHFTECEFEKRTRRIQNQLKQLRNLKFGPVEIDHLIIRVKEDPVQITKKNLVFYNVEVVGVVETKYNPNALMWGYKMRNLNLKWLTNAGEVLDERYKRPFGEKYFLDKDSDCSFYLTPQSFNRFRTENNQKKIMENIYFVTTNRPLVILNEEIIRFLKDKDSVSELKKHNIPNSFDHGSRNLLNEYDKNELWNNIVFTNDDFCGYSLEFLLFYHLFRNIFKKTGLDFAEYKYLNEDMMQILQNTKAS